eukprot:scaffold8150_cov72-Phaeocystis_antarctica.AAC.4
MCGVDQLDVEKMTHWVAVTTTRWCSLSAISLLLRVLEHVGHAEARRLRLPHLQRAAAHLAVEELAEEDGAAARRARHLRRVGRPRQAEDRAAVWLLARVAPAGLVAQAQHVERADGEVPPVGRPRHGGDRELDGGRAVQLPAVGVPHSVLAVLAARDDEVVDRVPVGLEHGGIMRLPLRLLRRRLQRPDHLVWVRARVRVWAGAIARAGAIAGARVRASSGRVTRCLPSEKSMASLSGDQQSV